MKAKAPKAGMRLLGLGARHCRYIVQNTGALARFCGARVAEGSSWCPKHYAICVEHTAGPCRWCGSDHHHDRRICYRSAVRAGRA